MSNEKADELMRDRLSGLGELPEGIHFNAGDTWNRLEAQLKPHTKKRRIVLLRVAALLAITGGSLVWVQHAPQKITPVAGEITTAAPVNIQPQLIHKKQEAVTDLPENENDIKKHTAAVAATQARMDTTAMNNPAPVAVNAETAGTKPPEMVPHTGLPPAASLIMPPEKKTKPVPGPRFRIVHVNELSALAAVQPEIDIPVLRKTLPFTVETTTPVSPDFAEQPGLLKKKTKVTSLSDQP
ncbi:hypothetical protein [Sediminibacterium ginsengisoli]|uniref:Uncharacterized protein n=1 Tax=Sediminibacterium ginsengisoli TaxID=413434 RepID=A0A1T4MKC7_9BACT|nr:hypothetical protein [Sediminibacterium ginsengisoli]SJZ67540.1 hypothetical protein SAMN04488132_103430 [Sediminibacterium ginsengisoli]